LGTGYGKFDFNNGNAKIGSLTPLPDENRFIAAAHFFIHGQNARLTLLAEQIDTEGAKKVNSFRSVFMLRF